MGGSVVVGTSVGDLVGCSVVVGNLVGIPEGFLVGDTVGSSPPFHKNIKQYFCYSLYYKISRHSFIKSIKENIIRITVL